MHWKSQRFMAAKLVGYVATALRGTRSAGARASARPSCRTHDGFALGKWLNQVRHRLRTATQPTRLGRQLTALDTSWNPLWPLDWQRYYWAARHHLHGLPDGVVWWPGRPDEDQIRQWLHGQQASWQHLHDKQRELVRSLAADTSSAGRRGL